MSFRKSIPQPESKTVREMVAQYGDDWYLYCASQPISHAVWMGDKMHGDRYDAQIMKQCEKGERDRVDDWDMRRADERDPVHVEHVFPPIPERCWDYRAYRDPDPGNPVGYGGTPFLAINDLIEQESET